MNNTENDHEKTPFRKEKLLGVPLLLCPVYWSFATVAVEILNKALSQDAQFAISPIVGKLVLFFCFTFLHCKLFHTAAEEENR
ncbi:hypothetical protein MASR1M12_05830 [Erysipelotrichia bacterium]